MPNRLRTCPGRGTAIEWADLDDEGDPSSGWVLRMNPQRFLVFGAGAIGSMVGGFLRAAGHDVVLLGRAPHLDAIRKGGLRIEGIWGRRCVRGFEPALCMEDLPDDPAPDWILVTVKSYDTEEAARSIRHRLRRGWDSRIVSLQNGLGNVERLERICRRPVMAARVITGAEIPAPGRVRVTVTADRIRIGEPGRGLSGDARRLASLLDRAGVPSSPTSRVEIYLWSKVVYNCALNAPATLLNCVYGDLARSEATRDLLRRIVREVYAVAAAEGISLRPATPGSYLRKLFGVLIPRTAAHAPSMLQDVRRGRRTEIDALNGAVAARARRLGLTAPVNEVITALIHAREEAGREGWANR